MNRKTFLKKVRAFNAFMKQDRATVIKHIQKEVTEYQKLVTDISLAMVPVVVDTVSAFGEIAEKWTAFAEDSESQAGVWAEGAIHRSQQYDNWYNQRMAELGLNDNEEREVSSER